MGRCAQNSNSIQVSTKMIMNSHARDSKICTMFNFKFNTSIKVSTKIIFKKKKFSTKMTMNSHARNTKLCTIFNIYKLQETPCAPCAFLKSHQIYTYKVFSGYPIKTSKAFQSLCHIQFYERQNHQLKFFLSLILHDLVTEQN